MNKLSVLRKKSLNLRPSTLAFLVKDGEVLLGLKKRGFGVGKWNGIGGKIEKEESFEDAFMRELEEEIGVRSTSHIKHATLHFYDPHLVENNFIVHVYLVHQWEGEIVETDEMLPKWYKYQDIPYPDMWPDDKIWLSEVLEGKKIEAHFLFDDQTQIAEFDVVVL